MNKLCGESAVKHAATTGAQLYVKDRTTGKESPVDPGEVQVQALLKEDPGALSCEGPLTVIVRAASTQLIGRRVAS